MKDIDLRYEQGVAHMPEEIAERAGFPTPYSVDEELAILELLVASDMISDVSTASFDAMRIDDHEAVSQHEEEADKLALRTRVLSAILDQMEVERSMSQFDESFDKYFGDGDDTVETIR